MKIFLISIIIASIFARPQDALSVSPVPPAPPAAAAADAPLSLPSEAQDASLICKEQGVVQQIRVFADLKGMNAIQIVCSDGYTSGYQGTQEGKQYAGIQVKQLNGIQIESGATNNQPVIFALTYFGAPGDSRAMPDNSKYGRLGNAGPLIKDDGNLCPLKGFSIIVSSVVHSLRPIWLCPGQPLQIADQLSGLLMGEDLSATCEHGFITQLTFATTGTSITSIRIKCSNGPDKKIGLDVPGTEPRDLPAKPSAKGLLQLSIYRDQITKIPIGAAIEDSLAGSKGGFATTFRYRKTVEGCPIVGVQVLADNAKKVINAIGVMYGCPHNTPIPPAHTQVSQRLPSPLEVRAHQGQMPQQVSQQQSFGQEQMQAGGNARGMLLGAPQEQQMMEQQFPPQQPSQLQGGINPGMQDQRMQQQLPGVPMSPQQQMMSDPRAAMFAPPKWMTG